MTVHEVIAAKRDGKRQTKQQIDFLIQGAVSGRIKDYQLSAWLMAAYLNGLDSEETAHLTQAMADSGERLDLAGLPKPWIDKHSTGGVGDKTSLVVLPIIAASGMTIVKMSGRGLGPTGGTIDKLSSVPGFRVDLTPEAMIAQAKSIGIALTGQTPDLAPADRILYALRDATATVDSIPLIVSSILSKKIAAGADVIVLDVKCGSGAFMHSLDQARALAKALKSTAEECGLQLEFAITDMSQPLGRCVGNALEVAEAIEVLTGRESGRFRELVLGFAALALIAAKTAGTREEAYAKAADVLDSGSALAKAEEWFVAQGASKAIFENPWSVLPRAPVIMVAVHEGPAGWVKCWDALTVGRTSVQLGGGRKHKTDEIDPSVGIESFIEVGERIESGDPIFTVHARTHEEAEDGIARLRHGLKVSEKPVASVPLFLD